jgi:flagellar biosynthesis protein FlhB
MIKNKTGNPSIKSRIDQKMMKNQNQREISNKFIETEIILIGSDFKDKG